MSDYTSGGHTSSDSTDNNQTTSDSDGSDRIDTPAASLQATPRPHATTIGVDEPPASGEDEDGDLYTLRIQSDRLSGGVYLQHEDALALTGRLAEATGLALPDEDDVDSDSDEDPYNRREASNGAVRFDITGAVQAYHYDDEDDTIVVTASDGSKQHYTPAAARTLAAALEDAARAIASERDADR